MKYSFYLYNRMQLAATEKLFSTHYQQLPACSAVSRRSDVPAVMHFMHSCPYVTHVGHDNVASARLNLSPDSPFLIQT